MALINCPECNHQVSTLATSCPNCGAPVDKVDNQEHWVNPDLKPLEDGMRKCSKCWQLNIETNEVCSRCGCPLPHYQEEVKINPTPGLNSKYTDGVSYRSAVDGGIKTKQLIGIIGSIVLFIGVFMPIVSVPIMGSMNYFQNGKGDGIIILILSVISLLFVLTKMYNGLWLTGLGSLGVMLFTFINFQSKMSEFKSSMESELEGNPFRGLADIALQSVQLQWGWAVLILGAALVIASAAISDN